MHRNPVSKHTRHVGRPGPAPGSVPRGRLVPVGPPGRRPGSPLPQPGLAIRAVGGRTSPAAGGLRSKQGGSLSLALGLFFSFAVTHASCCSGVQFSGSDSPSPPTQRSESRERVPPLGFSRGPRNNLACSSHRLRLRDPPLPRRSLSEAWWPLRSWLIQPPVFFRLVRLRCCLVRCL